MADESNQPLTAEELAMAAEMVAQHGEAAEDVIAELKKHDIDSTDEVINEFHFLFPDTDSLFDCAQSLTDDFKCEELDLGRNPDAGVGGYDDGDDDDSDEDSDDDADDDKLASDLPWYLIARYKMSAASASSTDWVDGLVKLAMQAGGLYDGWEVALVEDEDD